ncbi:DUF1642 domain-containing protein [Lactococcus lactis]|uniref:DUF1642 domain-containing protein n=1 Tax=Lactococcus lactis TaxID=1358 RepID=A0A552Z110_9LACT|nr:DUF1642 domain-containing protein [Lactococcus lactis]TRW73209.1 DUF1642 domain-containing protein [Lactococcus lactis]
MTKFEEEVKRPDNGPITELNNNMQEVFSQYRKMRQYADYLEYELKQKDEHILKVENENSFMRDERTTFDSNGMAVEPKFQQQALPVVPEFVAEWLDRNNLASLLDGWYCHHEDMSSHIREYFERLPYKGPNNLSEMENNIVTFIIRAKLGGYKLEKPQLFYIALPKVYGLSDSTFVSKAESGIISEFTKGKDYALKLTEQEIKSIDERYWQFAVPVEDGE